ncbi:hypothetical protein D1007_03243 [Hordeum vulgare]|nr:hypothetical protein D1007_03243 [Hordeum vulgare]
MKGNTVEGDKSMVFDSSPTYEEVVMKVRNALNWMDPNDAVNLSGRYDVGVGVKSRLKTMPITSELHWKVYKDIVLESQDNSLEIFVTNIELPLVQIDLNRHATSPIHDGRIEVYVPNSSSQPPNEAEMNDRAMVGDSKPKNEDKNAHLKKGIKLSCLEEFKIWLSGYAIRNNRPFVIDHSDQNLRYTIKCDKEGMASSGSILRPSCANREDMLNKWKEETLDKMKDKDLKTPPCWCGDVCKSPPPPCKYFTWIDHEVPEDVGKAQYEDYLWRQQLFEESLQHAEYAEHLEK